MRTIKCDIAREQVREYDIIVWENEMSWRSVFQSISKAKYIKLA